MTPEYMINSLKYLFGDDPEISGLLKIVTNPSEIDKQLKPFESVIIKKSGGLFGYGESTYKIACRFDMTIYNILERIGKLEFYDNINKCIHENIGTIKNTLHILDRAIKLNIDSVKLYSFLETLQKDVSITVDKFILCYILQLEPKQINAAFAQFSQIVENLRVETITLLNNYKIKLLESCEENLMANSQKEESRNECCGKRLRKKIKKNE